MMMMSKSHGRSVNLLDNSINISSIKLLELYRIYLEHVYPSILSDHSKNIRDNIYIFTVPIGAHARLFIALIFKLANRLKLDRP